MIALREIPPYVVMNSRMGFGMAGSESGRELLEHREPGVEGSAGVLPEMWDVHVGTISMSKTSSQP